MTLWKEWIATAMLALAVAGGAALGGNAQPATAPQSGAVAAADFPIPIRYTVPEAGNVVMAIDDAQGRRVRNLIAEAPRAAGDHVDLWDGRDDDGKAVKPGAYHFKAAVTPPLNLSYEFTVNNSGDPPWWKQDVWEPTPNPGGWMADHTPPQGAAAAAGKVFLGSEAAEHGHSLIAVDLVGHKIWGAKWLELAGSRCVCSDGKTIYSAGEGSWVGTHMKLFAIDPNNFAVRRIADVDFGSGPLAGQGNLTGLAARDGQVFASFSPPQKGIGAIAFDPALIDWTNTTTHRLPAAQFTAILRAGETEQPWINLPLETAKQEPLRIAWKTDQNIGTILSPHRLDVSALRPGAHYPGDLTNDADWIEFDSDMHSPAMKVYTAPPGARTRALRIRVLNAVAPLRLDQPQTSLKDSTGPASAFVGLRAVGSRLHAVNDQRDVVVSSGHILEGGAWDNHQESEITALKPATYTIQPHQPADISALVVRDPFFAKAHVELRVAPDAPWYSAGELITSFPWRRAYNDITLDLGRNRNVSAVRIVVTDPAVDQNSDVKKRSGLTHQVCGLGGVLLLANHPEPGPGQRISVYNAQSGELVRDIPITLPGALTFDPSGRLLAVSDGRVVSVPPTGGPVTPVIAAGLREPSGLTCDAKGSIYVADAGDNVVKRFTSDGKPAGVTGKPGGIDPGPYDPERMSNPQGICIDASGRLWVAEAEMRPKKVSVWDLQGSKRKLERYFIGGPRYGSGFMYIDPRESSRFFLEGMEFHVNWETGFSEIKNIVWREDRGGAWEGVTCDRPVYVHDHLYLLGEPFWFYGNRYFAIARYEKDHAVPVAAAGKADQWPPLRDPGILQSLGNPDLTHYSFVWSDLNDNGKVDPGEVKLGPPDLRLETAYFGARGGTDLTIQFANERFVPISYTPGGAPVYDFEHMTPTPVLHPGGFGLYNTAVTSTGDFIEVSDRIAVHDSKGEARWAYPDHFNGVHGSAKAPPPQPGLLAGTLHVIGSATLPNVGELFAVSTNKGEVCLFTTDGLWIARLFRDNRYGRGFNLPKAERGMNLNDVSLNTEHFGGTFNQLADGRIFLVAGHNHNSVIRLDGLDLVRRMEGNVVVTEEQARAADHAAKELAIPGAEPKHLLIARSAGGFKIDGDLADWSKLAPLSLTGTGEHQAKVWLAYDPEALLIAFDVQGTRGMVNHEKDWKLLFRAGDCVDLQLRTDLNGAPPSGQGAAGELRIVITMQDGHSVAVIYRPVVPGTAADKKVTFASPVGSVTFDVIEQIDLDAAVVERKDGYCLEAAIPWKTLGVKPVSGLKLLGDIGVLFADSEGISTVERIYWSNHAAGLVADVPGEARLQPEHWGEMELQ